MGAVTTACLAHSLLHALRQASEKVASNTKTETRRHVGFEQREQRPPASVANAVRHRWQRHSETISWLICDISSDSINAQDHPRPKAVG